VRRSASGSRENGACGTDDEYGPVSASYTRAEAFQDGSLIQIPPEAASAAGIAMSVVITAGARQQFMGANGAHQEERLWTVRSAVARAVEQAPADEVCFVVPAGELPSGQGPTALTGSSPSPGPAMQVSPS